MTGTLAPSVTATAGRCAQVLAEVERVIVGKHEAVSQVLLGILASGHLLIEDLPGLGKTLLARTFAATLGLPTFGLLIRAILLLQCSRH